MSAIRSNGALWQSGEHRAPVPPSASRSDAGRPSAADVMALHRELGRWKTHAADLERQLAVAKAQALTSQLTPHFLCNSLQAVSTLVHRDPRTADAMVVALSQLLRMVLRGADAPEVPVARELALVERYVDVMRFRFGSDLGFLVDAAPGTRGALVPQLLLQPLVENAILHGFADDGGEIRIRVERRGDLLHCAVADNGRGLRPGPLLEGIGLSGARARLRAMYGERQCLDLTTNEVGGVTVTLALPFRIAGNVTEVEP